MKIDLNKNELLIIIIIGITICFLPFAFTINLGLKSFEDTGQIGDTIGGITAPFLSFFGSILVYLALKSQITANKEITKQNRDSIFFKIFDSYKSNISSIDYIDRNGKKENGYNLLMRLNSNLSSHYMNQKSMVGKSILIHYPEIIEFESYKAIYCAKHNNSNTGNINAFRKRLIDSEDIWSRRQILDKMDKNDILKDAYEELAAKYQSMSKYQNRSSTYTIAYAQTILDEMNFYLSYFNQFIYVLRYIDTISKTIAKNEINFYLDFLNNNLQYGEKSLITSCFLGKAFNYEEGLLIHKYIRFEEFTSIELAITSIASKEQIMEDIDYTLQITKKLSEKKKK